MQGKAEPGADLETTDLRRRTAAAASVARVFDEDVDLVLVLGPDALLLHVSSSWARILGEVHAPVLGRPLPEALQIGGLASAD